MGARVTGKAIHQTGERGGIPANSPLSRWLAWARGARVGAVVLWGLACASYLARPGETFGAAGWLWLLSMALFAVSALGWGAPFPWGPGGPVSDKAGVGAELDTQYAIRDTSYSPNWTRWEV